MPLFNAPRSIANRHRDSPCAIFLVTDRANSRGKLVSSAERRASTSPFPFSSCTYGQVRRCCVGAPSQLGHRGKEGTKRRKEQSSPSPSWTVYSSCSAGTIGKTRDFVAENARIRAGSRIIQLGIIKRISKRRKGSARDTSVPVVGYPRGREKGGEKEGEIKKEGGEEGSGREFCRRFEKLPTIPRGRGVERN